MSANPAPVTRLPPHQPVRGLASAFGVLAGPVAWFTQLCAGYAFASWPCFPNDHRHVEPLRGYDWSGTAVDVITACALVIALAALLVSRGIYQRTSAADGTARLDLRETGRVRFLALWGMATGGGFSVAIIFTGIAYFILPRCAG